MNRGVSGKLTISAAVVAAAIAGDHIGAAAQQPPPGVPAHKQGQQAPQTPGQKPPVPGQKMGGPGHKMGGPGQMGPGKMGPGKTGGPGKMGGPPKIGGPGKMGGPAAPGKAVAVAPPIPPRVHRKGVDPFKIPWSVPPPPPYVFENILPVRLAEADVEPPPVNPITIREEPTLRVSGIMTGDGVFAILEQAGGKVEIVKPGSSLDIGTSGGSRTYRVASIKDDTVTLESVEGNTTYQQIVPLSDAPIGTSPGSFGGGGIGRPGAGMPSTGSGGGLGRPGIGRRGPGGAGAGAQ